MLKQEHLTTLERKIDRFSQILEKNPGDGLTVLALAEASFRRGLKLEALTAYQAVTHEQPVPEAHLAVAEIYSQQDMTTEAYGELRELFELDPENVEARLLARELEAKAAPPEDIEAILMRPTSEEAFHEAKLRLQLQRAIHNRELQERTRNGTLEPGVVIHEYYIEEAKKKLIEVDEQLKKLEDLRIHNTNLSMEPPTPEPISAEAESVAEEPQDALIPEDAVPAPEFPPENESVESELPPVPVATEGSLEQESVPVAPLEPVLPEPEAAFPSSELSPPAPEMPSGAPEISIPSLEEAAPAVPEAPPLSVPEEVQTPVDSGEFPAPPVEVPMAEAPELVEEVPASPIELSLDSSEGTAVEPGLEPELPSGEFSAGVETELTLVEPPALGQDMPSEEVPAEVPAEVSQPSLELDVPGPPPMVPDLPSPEELLPADLPEPPALDLEPSVETAAVSEEPAELPPLPETPEPPAPEQPQVEVNFEIGVQPLTPDLPEPAQEPLPIQMGDEPPMPSLTSPVPVAGDPLSAPPAIEPLPTGSREEAPPEQAAPAPVAQEAPTVEVSQPAAQAVSAAERQAFYESKAEELGKLTGTLARTRGVTSIFLVSRDGATIDSVVKDNITEERVGELVAESFDFLLAYADSPSYWVLECAGGIFVMQTLDEDHVLIAVGQAGANFGALRYTMDKTKAKFGAILSDVPR